MRRCLPLVAVGVLLASCSSEEPYVERPLEDLYYEAAKEFNDKDFSKAAKCFEEVERQHPYSMWSVKAQLLAAFSHYMAMEYDDCLRVLDVFLQYHPTHKDLAYAYYLKGMCYRAQVSDANHDSEPSYKSREVFEELSKRFPDTKYSKEALGYIKESNMLLAGHEMVVGRFYQKVKDFQSSLERFQRVISKYPNSTMIEEAYYRIVEDYTAIGLRKEAKETYEKMRAIYPKGLWTKRAYTVITTTR